MNDTSFSQPMPRPGVLEIEAYSPGKSTAARRRQGLQTVVERIAASARARWRWRHSSEAALELERYPDGSADSVAHGTGQPLRAQSPENIVCGAGSDELLSLIGAGISEGRGRGDLLRTRISRLSDRHQGERRQGGRRAGERFHGRCRCHAEAGERARRKIVFLANPNNPTGTYLPFDEVRRLHAGLPAGTLLVLDAAYAEYVRQNDYEAGVELVSTFSNVVMLRTFSKVYGLAGLRIGWAYCPASCGRRPQPHSRRVQRQCGGDRCRDGGAGRRRACGAGGRAQRAVDARGSPRKSRSSACTPHRALEIFCSFISARGRRRRRTAICFREVAYLRRMEVYGLPNALRLTVGSEEANHAFIAALAEFARERQAPWLSRCSSELR